MLQRVVGSTSLPSIDAEVMERNPDNLFFSDNVNVYSDDNVRPAILVIYLGLIYFVIKDDALLSSAP